MSIGRIHDASWLGALLGALKVPRNLGLTLLIRYPTCIGVCMHDSLTDEVLLPRIGFLIDTKDQKTCSKARLLITIKTEVIPENILSEGFLGFLTVPEVCKGENGRHAARAVNVDTQSNLRSFRPRRAMNIEEQKQGCNPTVQFRETTRLQLQFRGKLAQLRSRVQHAW